MWKVNLYKLNSCIKKLIEMMEVVKVMWHFSGGNETLIKDLDKAKGLLCVCSLEATYIYVRFVDV